MGTTIFVTNDEPTIRAAMVKRLSRPHHHVVGYESGEALLAVLEHEIPDLIILDLNNLGLNGLDTVRKLGAQAPNTLVIVVIALADHGTVQNAVEAMKLGAHDVLIKTADLDGLDAVVDRTLEYLRLRRRFEDEQEHRDSQYALENLEAHNPTMQQVLEQVREVAAYTKSTVLLQGDTGTGKAFLARVIHHNGHRTAGPFVEVRCSAIPKERFERALFGVERGALTGAAQRTVGLLEKAVGGTLFLDEIGDLDLAMQAKLLRVIQERSFRRIDGTDDIEADFRLIAATRRNLKNAVASGRFREALYFSLNVVSLEIPPLSQRGEDILPLCRRAVLRYGKEMGKDIVEIDPEASLMLQRYTYPGNIRELHNIIERAVIFEQGKTLTASHLPAELRQDATQPVVSVLQGQEQTLRLEVTLGKQSLVDIENAVIQAAVRLSDYNKTTAARHLGLTRFSLERRLKKIYEN